MENQEILNVSDDILTETPEQPSAPAKKRKKLAPYTVGNIIVTIALSIGAIVMLLPFLWMVLTTFKPSNEIYGSAALFPQKWTGQGYIDMWKTSNRIMYNRVQGAAFLQSFLSSILTTVPVVAVQIVVSAFAAYAFAKLHFVGKNVIFLVLLSTMMIPFAVVMLPQAWLYGKMGLIKTGPLAVIVPKFFGSIGTVCFLRAFFAGIPDSITEAARLDGAGYTRTFVSVLLPLVMPAIATQAILSFMGNWNDFLGPLLYITNRKWYTLPLLVNALNNSGDSNPATVPLTLAGSLLSLVPVLIVFAAFQKKIVGSIVFAAVKG